MCSDAGASIPSEAMMHSLPLFQISPQFSKFFSDFVENFPNFTFDQKFGISPYFMHPTMHVLDAPAVMNENVQ